MRHNYRTLIKEPTSRLLNHEKKHRHNIIGSRIRMLRLLKQGEAKSVREASELIGYSWRHAQKWLTTYRTEGLAGMLEAPKKPGGRPELMTPAAWNALNQALERGEIKSYGEARELLAEQGVAYAGESSIHRLFKRHRIKAKAGRYQHEKSDPEVIEGFKKTSPSS